MGPDEYVLAIRARDGDLEALAELVERVRLRLFALAYAELRHYEDAQDAVASALLRICRHVGSLKEPERVRHWMHSIVRNEARRLVKARGQEALAAYREEDQPHTAEWRPSLLRLDIERALRRLPADQASAVALFYLGESPIAEIARLIERPEGTIKSWLHQGRRRLALEMEAYAPMTQEPATREWTASIVSSDFEPAVREQLTDALKAAGYSTVNIISDYRDIFRPEETSKDNRPRYHLAPPLAGSDFVVLDEKVGGCSTLELFPALRGTPEGKKKIFCLLMSMTQHTPTDDMLILSAYIAGLDFFLTKPFNPAEVGSFAKRAREKALENP
jgi:RNA polymerase sigma-70 factor (ECF subfamily)